MKLIENFPVKGCSVLLLTRGINDLKTVLQKICEQANYGAAQDNKNKLETYEIIKV
jgi:hypothetical protein